MFNMHRLLLFTVVHPSVIAVGEAALCKNRNRTLHVEQMRLTYHVICYAIIWYHNARNDVI